MTKIVRIKQLKWNHKMGAKEKNELEELIHQGDERSYPGRFKRLKFLLSVEEQTPFRVSALAAEYYEEARLCWYVGAFVSTIIMTQLAFEELFRAHYRAAMGVGGKLDCGKKVNDASLFSLLQQARKDGWISLAEANLLNELRKDLRNPYVHVKDVSVKDEGKQTRGKRDFFIQFLKIKGSPLIPDSVEKEAQKAIQLLVTLFPVVSERCGGT